MGRLIAALILLLWTGAAHAACPSTITDCPSPIYNVLAANGVVNVKAAPFNATGNGVTDDTAAIQAAAAAVPAGGAQLFFPPGNYLISNTTNLKSNTYMSGPGATITAAVAASWPGGQIQRAFLGATNASNITIDSLNFVYPEGSVLHGGGAGHILEFVTGNTHIVIQNNTSDGGGDLVADVGATDVREFNNKATNVFNVCFDHWNSFTDAMTIGNTCTTLASAGAGVAGIAYTGISTGGGVASSYGVIAIGNEITVNNANAQGITINGFATCGGGAAADRFVVADNRLLVNAGSWGILINGCANNGDVHDNYLEATAAAFPAIGVFTPATNVQVHDNLAMNWVDGTAANGVFENTAVGGSLIHNISGGTASTPTIGATDATTVLVGNGEGTSVYPLKNVNITTGSASFDGSFTAINSPVFGWAGAGGIVGIINGAANHAAGFKWQTATVDHWFEGTDGTTQSGSNAGDNWQFVAKSDAGANLSIPIAIQRSSGHHILGSTTGVAVGSGTGDCGTSPVIAGNDNVGRITVGSSTNGGKCTVTFANSWTNAPVCQVANETSAARPVYPLTVGTSSFAITASATITASDSLSYRCVGY